MATVTVACHGLYGAIVGQSRAGTALNIKRTKPSDRPREEDMDQGLSNLVNAHLAERGSAVSIGCFGALAEFQDDTAVIQCSDAHYTAVSSRGALRLDSQRPCRVIAYETLSASANAWQCGIAATVRASEVADACEVLTELGPDHAAIRTQDEGALLFDLGVGAANVDYCVRTGDARLIDVLRRHCAERVIFGGSPLLDQLIDFSPHRVVRSAVGRLEVYQRIDRHQTPSGPHTHLLPDLLARRRTHSANLPLPRGDIPVLTLHPENPLFDEHAVRRIFSRRPFDSFEVILEKHGLPGYFAEKQRLRAAVAAGDEPSTYRHPTSRPTRLAMRIALRQLVHTMPDAPHVIAWHRHFRP